MILILYLRKLIKIIRADSAPSQVAFGCLLGMLLGMPPIGFASFVLLLLFFLLSANLGAFLFAAGVGKLLSVLLGPFLNSVGESLLEMEALKGLWRGLLNLPGISLCGYDQYFRFGATVIALGIGVGLFFCSLLLVTPLRRKLRGWAEKSPGLSRVFDNRPMRFLFGGSKTPLEEREEKFPVLRKGFAVPMILFLVAFSIFWTLGGDRVTERGLEFVSTQVTGKHVELGQASLAFLGGSLKVAEMKVTEPTPSGPPEIAEGERLVFGLSPLQFLNRRVVVDEMAVENMTLHPGTDELPQPPPEPEPGEPVDFGKVVDWIEGHEEQIRWALDQLDGILQKGDEEPEPDAPGYEGRAGYVYGTRTSPAMVVRAAGIRNLMFDWKDAEGPLTRLSRLDLSLENLSSHPSIHGEPIKFSAGGLYGEDELSLEGIFDLRGDSTEGHSLKLGLTSDRFGVTEALGLTGGSGLSLELVAGFDPGTRRLRGATCRGHFSAEGISEVKFALDAGEHRAFELDVRGADLSALAGLARPDALSLEQGNFDFAARVGLRGSGLDGRVSIRARDLKISPGKESTLAGLRARDVCKGLNALTRQQPLEVSFLVGGSSSAPTVSLDEKGLSDLLGQVKTGLVMAGEKALAAEVDRRLSPLQEKLDGLLGDKQKELEDKVGKNLGGVVDGLLGGKKSRAGKALDQVGEGVTEKAGSVLGGILGGKKKKKNDDDKDENR